MQAAISYGLTHSAEEIMQQSQFTCPSGNCTWGPFESLAVCSVCNNLSEDISTTQNTTTKEDIALMPSIEASNAVPIGDVVTFHLRNGHLIDNIDTLDTSSPFMTSYGTGNKNETVSLQEVDDLLWGMSFLRVTNQEKRPWPKVDLEATECGLYYCVKQYNATVRNGTLFETEKQVTSASRATDSWLPQSDDDTRKLASLEWLDSLNFKDSLSSVQRSDLMLGDHFNLSQTAIDGISSFLQTNFAGEERNSELIPGSKLNGYSKFEAHYSPSSIQVFRSAPNLNATFQALARSMSNTLRADSDNRTVYTGRNGTMQTIYRIVWPWIALHAAVIIIGTAFLLMTIYESRKHTIPVWRSSSLAVLSRASATKDILHGLGTREKLEIQAAQARVQLLERKPRLKGMPL